MLQAQQAAEASMDTTSQRSDSMDSVRTEDDGDSRTGACYETHLERHSPTSLLPEHPFSIPVLKVPTLLKGYSYRRLSEEVLCCQGYCDLIYKCATAVLIVKLAEAAYMVMYETWGVSGRVSACFVGAHCRRPAIIARACYRAGLCLPLAEDV